MKKLVIIADDLTGCNATAVLLARTGYKAATFLRLVDYHEEDYPDLQVISLNTESRAISPGEAYRRVHTVAAAMIGKEIAYFCKRIDSTLRGNLGSEIDAVLDVLGGKAMAVLVAAFPSSGRVTIGGYLMVNSIPLEKTDAARDPKTPVHESAVPKLVAAQTKYSVGHIELDKVLKTPEIVKEALVGHYQEGKRIVVVDATTNDDLDLIAKAAHLSGLMVVAVDPGPFTKALSRYFLPEPKRLPGQKVLMVIGSVTPLTYQQMHEAERHYEIYFAYANPVLLIDQAEVRAEIKRVAAEILAQANDYSILGIRTLAKESDVLDLRGIAMKEGITEDEISKRISGGLGGIAAAVLRESHQTLGALYTSGGDVTVAVCNELGAAGVEVKDEVLPLAAYGRLIGGECNNMPIITKGGLVGGPDALIQCLDYLLTKVSNEYYPN